MLKAVIFDVDGVLVDSLDANVVLYQRLLTKAGYPKPPRKAVVACFHLPLWQTVEKLAHTQEQAEIQRIWDLAHDPSLRDPGLMRFPQQLKETLEALHKKYKLAIVTSRIRVGLEGIFNQKKIGHLFDTMVSYEDYTRPKPHPEPLLVALKKLKIEAAEAVYVGDSEVDIEAALAAGMPCIHLTKTPHPSATAAIQEFHQLLAAIESLL